MGSEPVGPLTEKPREWLAMPGGRIRPVVSVPSEDGADELLAYEAWLAKHTSLVASDLNQKHVNMATGDIVFLRATFFRWAQRFPEVCPELNELPAETRPTRRSASRGPARARRRAGWW